MVVYGSVLSVFDAKSRSSTDGYRDHHQDRLFFMRHLQNHMHKVYREQQAQYPITITFTVFRGQGLPHEYFNKMKLEHRWSHGIQ